MVDTEKITINMSVVDLGQVDLLVDEGFYSSRTDFIRTAIRSQLEKHTFEIQQSVERHSYIVGVLSYDKNDFDKFKQKGEKLTISVIGLLHLHNDITTELAQEVIESLQVRGVFVAREDLKVALADRTN